MLITNYDFKIKHNKHDNGAHCNRTYIKKTLPMVNTLISTIVYFDTLMLRNHPVKSSRKIIILRDEAKCIFSEY